MARIGRPPQTLSVRFWPKVEKTDGCWLWKGNLQVQGYGTIRDDAGRNIGAHRAAWQLTHGCVVPKGLGVLHRCDNKRCVNPAHLWVGTQQDNIDDKMRKGREARGQDAPIAKLTEQHVRELRFIWLTGRFSLDELAAKYGVAKSTAERAIHGQTWAHIPGAAKAMPHADVVKRAGDTWRHYPASSIRRMHSSE